VSSFEFAISFALVVISLIIAILTPFVIIRTKAPRALTRFDRRPW
jgi:hypothetical protein